MEVVELTCGIGSIAMAAPRDNAKELLVAPHEISVVTVPFVESSTVTRCTPEVPVSVEAL